MANRTVTNGDMAEQQDFDTIIQTNDTSKKLSLQYGAYELFILIRNFFLGRKIAVNHQSFADVAETLVNNIDKVSDRKYVEACNTLLEMQRNIENTRARRRLEKWSSRVIGWYLIIVAVIIFANYSTDFEFLDIDKEVMIVILSTTTVNIIGLGLIVLRGHFQTKEKIPPRSNDGNN